MLGKDVGKAMSQGPDEAANGDEGAPPSPVLDGGGIFSDVELLTGATSVTGVEFLGRKRRSLASCRFHPATLILPSSAQ